MTTKAQHLGALIREVRAAFQDLRAQADSLHAGLGVNASMRAVLERLNEPDADPGGETVPQIARAKNVSRQHIQIIVDALREAGLVALEENPAHKRSPLVRPTAEGRRLFAKVQAREEDVLTELAAQFTTNELQVSREVLSRLHTLLDDRS